MNAFVCPKGHTSADPDYCSECGAKIPAAASGIIPAAPAAQENCPDCGTPREQGGAVFCDVCGFNFNTGAHGELGAMTAAPEPPAAPLAAAPPTPAAWSLTISVDPALRDPGSPDPPAIFNPFSVTLKDPVSLIGRKSTARAIFPEIPLTHDDAVSHRHALLQLEAGGTLSLRDIGASNGTRLNGQDLKPMVDYPLHDGDQITLGHWTRIGVKAVPA